MVIPEGHSVESEMVNDVISNPVLGWWPTKPIFGESLTWYPAYSLCLTPLKYTINLSEHDSTRIVYSTLGANGAVKPDGVGDPYKCSIQVNEDEVVEVEAPITVYADCQNKPINHQKCCKVNIWSQIFYF